MSHLQQHSLHCAILEGELKLSGTAILTLAKLSVKIKLLAQSKTFKSGERGVESTVKQKNF